MTTFERIATTAFAVGALLFGGMTGSAQAAQADRPDPKTPYAEGMSEPSQRAKLAAQVPGIVKEILAKHGEEVKKGEPLIQQDDRLALNKLEILEKEASSNIRVEAAQADLEQKKVELKRWEQLAAGNAANPLELERARLEVIFKGHQLNLASLELEKAKLEAVGAKLKVDFMKILAPFDGFIESIDTGVGEMLDPQRPGMITVVQNDPVRIGVYLTAPQAAKLKKGDKLDVRYKNDPSDAWQQATVESLAPVATAGAGRESQRLVRLTMPNPSKRETGLWLWVKLPEATETAAAAGSDAAR